MRPAHEGGWQRAQATCCLGMRAPVLACTELLHRPVVPANRHPPVSQLCGMPWSMRYGQLRSSRLGLMLEGVLSGMDESYRKPASASALRPCSSCSRKGALPRCVPGRRAGAGSGLRGGGLLDCRAGSAACRACQCGAAAAAEAAAAAADECTGCSLVCTLASRSPPSPPSLT